MELSSRRRWRLVSAQSSYKFGYCRKKNCTYFLTFQKQKSSPHGRCRTSSSPCLSAHMHPRVSQSLIPLLQFVLPWTSLVDGLLAQVASCKLLCSLHTKKYYASFTYNLNLTIPGHFLLYFRLVNTVLIKVPMTGFKPQPFCVGRDCSTNCVTNTAPPYSLLPIMKIRSNYYVLKLPNKPKLVASHSLIRFPYIVFFSGWEDHAFCLLLLKSSMA